jgi:hypothetical protein
MRSSRVWMRSSRVWLALIFSDPDPTFQLNSDPYPDPVKDPTYIFPLYSRLVSELGCIL